MATFPGLYRAKAVKIDTASVTVQIPQVYGEATVTITEFVGDKPTTVGMGWVTFRSGDPAFPVWNGGGSGGGGGGSAANGLPPGGTAGQALTKVDATNYNAQWTTISGGGGVPTTRIVGTTAPLSGGGALSADLSLVLLDDGVTNPKLANMATQTIKGRNTAGTGDPEDVPVATVKTMLSLTKSDVGLGNVDNTSDATKPVSTATQTALNAKADASSLTGYQPLDSDLTAIGALAPANDTVVQRKAGAWTASTPATLKTDLALTKSDVGLTNVDNTSDVNKPVSTAQTAAFAPIRQVIPTSTSATTYTVGLTDENKFQEFTAATAIAMSVPTNAVTPCPIGFRFDFFQTGAGKITVTAVTPGTTTIIATPSAVLRAVGSAASLTKLAADRWLLAGDLT